MRVPQNTNRHSFALGDTDQLSRMFGADWFEPQIAGQSNSQSIVNPSFSNSWLNKEIFNNDENVIQRPRSADISSWAVPSWQPLTNQQGIHWKGPQQQQQQQQNRRASSALSTSRPQSFVFDTSETIDMDLIKGMFEVVLPVDIDIFEIYRRACVV